MVFEANAKILENQNVVVEISWLNKNITHVKIQKQLRITGKAREKQGLILMANGITNTKADNINFNLSNDDPGELFKFN